METVIHSPHHRLRRADYIGDCDQDVLAFISNLAHRMEEPPPLGPEAYGLAPSDAAIIIAARDRYPPLFQACGTNDRTTTRVCAKNEARDEADRISRRYAQIIKNMPQDRVSDSSKGEVGPLGPAVMFNLPVSCRKAAVTGEIDEVASDIGQPMKLAA